MRRALTACVAAAWCFIHAAAAQTPVQTDVLTVGRSGAMTLEAGRGRVVALPGEAANVFVADPKVVEVRPAGPSTLFVFGTGVGGTTFAALDADGKVLSQVQVAVLPSAFTASGAAGAIRRTGAGAQVTTNPNGLTLNGGAPTPDQANREVAAASQFVPKDQVVQNRLAVPGSIQVSLQVSIAEMSRDVTREIGVDWHALGTIGKYAVGFASPVALATTTTLSGAAIPALGQTFQNTGVAINNIIEALAQDNLARMLAQPNLTAMSGETASFLVGGEFPIPVAQQNNEVTVAFKTYGIALSFIPTVLTSGRINLHVYTEVSALTQQGAVTLSTIAIPAITIRRADTTVELGSGQSFAIAGLLQDMVTQQDSSIPGLGELPVIGTLFRSTSFEHKKSELVVIVTPVLVTPVNDRSRLHTPDEDYVAPNDGQRDFLIHSAERRNGPVPIAATPGLGGFVLE